jgi:amino-acid N-acetyltransferase
MKNGVRIRAAKFSDRTRIVDFLSQVNLRGDDVLETHTRYWVAETDDHSLVGSVELELGSDSVLLRSMAVSPDFRNNGLGLTLVNTALNYAKVKGIKNVYLFSVSSGAYWQKMGFQKVPVDELVQTLPEIPQVLRFTAIGKLATETAWKKQLASDMC